MLLFFYHVSFALHTSQKILAAPTVCPGGDKSKTESGGDRQGCYHISQEKSDVGVSTPGYGTSNVARPLATLHCQVCDQDLPRGRPMEAAKHADNTLVAGDTAAASVVVPTSYKSSNEATRQEAASSSCVDKVHENFEFNSFSLARETSTTQPLGDQMDEAGWGEHVHVRSRAGEAWSDAALPGTTTPVRVAAS